MATTGYYLLDNRNRHGDHFYPQREKPVLAIVVHITAGLEDLDYTDDQSAEATARYAATTDRRVSWHSGSDSDSYLRLLPTSYTAWHATGYNSCTIGHEVSKKDTVWADEPPEWRTRTLSNTAACLAPDVRRHKIPLRRATKAELDAAIAHYERTGEARPVGFVAHADLDPTRRSDPGKDFPWARFLSLFAQEEDDMPLTDDDVARVARALREELNRGTAVPDSDTKIGGGSWAVMASADYRRLREVEEAVKRIEQRLAGPQPTPSPSESAWPPPGPYRVTYEPLT